MRRVDFVYEILRGQYKVHTMRDIKTFLHLFVLLGIHVAEASSGMLGYGSSNTVIPVKDQENFYIGFETGFKNTYAKKPLNEFVIPLHISDGSPLGALKSADELLKKNVIALLGYPTSHEALLAAKLASQKKKLSIFIAASHSKLAQMGPYIFTTGESMELQASTMLAFAEKKYQNKKALLIVNPEAAYSQNLNESFQKFINTKKLAITTIQLTKEKTISSEQLQLIAKGGFDYLMFTSYASDSVKLLEQLAEAKIDLPMIANSSWVTGDIDFVRRVLARKKSPLFGITIWVKGSPDSIPFESALKKHFGIDPTPETAYGYDLGVIVGTIVKKNNGMITKKSFEETFRKNLCYEGTVSGKICFVPNGGHANRKLHIVRYSPKGFELLK